MFASQKNMTKVILIGASEVSKTNLIKIITGRELSNDEI